jgi:Zn-dependent alcohol dehydrogenase
MEEMPGLADIIIDTTGISAIITQGISHLSGKGRMILVGQPAPGQSVEMQNAINLFNGNGQVIKATQGGKTKPQEDIPRYIKLHQRGLLDIRKLITHTFSINEVNAAFDLLRTGNAGRIMIQTS